MSGAMPMLHDEGIQSMLWTCWSVMYWLRQALHRGGADQSVDEAYARWKSKDWQGWSVKREDLLPLSDVFERAAVALDDGEEALRMRQGIQEPGLQKAHSDHDLVMLFAFWFRAAHASGLKSVAVGIRQYDDGGSR